MEGIGLIFFEWVDELWIIEDDGLFTEFQKMSLTGQRGAHQSPRNPEAETGALLQV